MKEAHKESHDKMYLAIAASLGGLTIISYVGDLMEMARPALITLVLLVALVKATLVATFFMHLKVDWTKVKVMIIPAIILAVILVVALLPDIAMAPRESKSPRPPLEAQKGAHAPAHGH